MDFNNSPERKNTNSVKWNKKALKGLSGNENAIPMWVADMDFPPEHHIKKKGIEIADLGVYGYPVFDDIIDKGAYFIENRHNWKIDKSKALFSMGLLHGIGLSIDLFTKKGDKILVPSPTYRPFRELCRLSDRVMVDHELEYKDGQYSLNRERFIEDAEKSDMILFCSPHNPSGLVFSLDELLFVLETAKRLDIPVISDEIHADLVHPGVSHIPMGKANEKIGAKVITLFAPSKTFNVAGEHSAIIIFSDEKMKSEFEKKQAALWLTTPGYLIGELMREAYQNGLEYNKKLTEYLKENADYIREYLKDRIPELKLANGNASFVTFIDCSEIYEKAKERVLSNPDKYAFGKDAGVLSLFFGVDGGVAMNDGTWFGEQYKDFVRINYGCSRKMLKKALEGIEKAVKSLR